jgi:hypothetical protein
MRERDPHGNPLPAAHHPDVKYPRGGQGSAQVPSDPHTVTVLPDADARKPGGHGVALRFNGDAAQNWASASCGEDS